MRPAVLLFHSRSCDELAADLLRYGDFDIVVAYESVMPLLAARGVPHSWLFDDLPHERRQRILHAAAARAQEAIARFEASQRPRWPAWGEGHWEALRRHVLSRLQDDFMNEAVFIEALRACASRRDLRLIIVPQDICRDTKAVTLEANRLGIPVLHLLHGFPNGAVNLQNEFYADRLAAFSGRVAGMYESMGLGRSRIAITGNPYWDGFLRPMRPGWRQRALERTGLEDGRPTIVLAITYTHALSEVSARYPDYVREMAQFALDELGRLFRGHPDWQLLIRPHPHMANHVPDLEGKARAAGIERVWVDTTLPPQAALSLASLVICTQSNLGIEGLLLGVPAIDLVLRDLAQPVYDEGLGPLYWPEDAIWKVSERADFAPAVEALMTGPEAADRLFARREATIAAFNGYLDPVSSGRFSRHAVSLMSYPPRKANAAPDPESWAAPLAESVAREALAPVSVEGTHAEWLRAALESRGVSVEPAAGAVVLAQRIEAQRLIPAARAGQTLFACAAGVGPDARALLGEGAWAPVRRGPWERADDLAGFGIQALDRALCVKGWRLADARGLHGHVQADGAAAFECILIRAEAHPAPSGG